MKRFFILRVEHEKAFAQAGLKRFASKAVRMLKADHSKYTANKSDDALLKSILTLMDWMRPFDLKTERQMYYVIEGSVFMDLSGLDITRDQRVTRVLLNSVATADDKAKAIRQIAFSQFDRVS